MNGRRPPSGHDMICHQAVALVTEYLDGALTPYEAARFRAHLAECPHCTEHVAHVKAAIAATGQVGPDDLDPAAREDLMQLYHRWRAEAAR